MNITRVLFWLWRTVRLPDTLRWMVVANTNQKFLVGVSAVILNEQNEVLLFEHTYRSPYAWGLPSGWLQRSEDPAQGIEREVYEESHLAVRITGILSITAARSVPRVDLVYQGTPAGGVFQPSDEVSAAQFFAQNALPPLMVNQLGLIQLAIEQAQKVQR
jgi:ADP-ribose pyrophosphatase YjhB (NUDIX family)